jgi:hypothetical protein
LDCADDQDGQRPEFLLVAVNAPGFSALFKGWLAVVGFDE